MGSIGGLLGLGGGAGGSGFSNPVAADILTGVDTGQAANAYKQTQQGMQQQQALLQALQGAGGIANQSNIYNQLQGVANGTGPNPAMAALKQATGQNVANQGALMAGQRGASHNVGLIARQAGQQGANIQQQAAGQGATLQAQQALNAINASGNIANTQVGNQIGQTNANLTGQQAQYGNILNAINALNANRVSMQGNINNANAGLAQTTMQGNQAITGGIMQGMGLFGAMAEGGEVEKFGQYRTDVESVPAPNITSSPTPPGPSPIGKSKDGGDKQSIFKTAMSLFALADGGEASSGYAGQSQFGHFLSSVHSGGAPSVPAPNFTSANPGAEKLKTGVSELTKSFNPSETPFQRSASDLGTQIGSGVGGSVAPGFSAASSATMGASNALSGLSFAKGGEGGRDFTGGGKVVAKSKGEKANVKGDSYSNDKIDAVLSEHEIVLPRTVTLSDDPVGNAARFVQAVLAKKGRIV